MIDQKDFIHGAALVAIAETPGFTALNKASHQYGHYVINRDRYVFVKYSGSKGPDYLFTFTPAEIKRVINSNRLSRHVYAVLVCGKETITALSAVQLRALIAMPAADAQSVTIRAEPRKRLRIHGAQGPLGQLIPRHSFSRQ